jgi:hypothetical protein
MNRETNFLVMGNMKTWKHPVLVIFFAILIVVLLVGCGSSRLSGTWKTGSDGIRYDTLSAYATITFSGKNFVIIDSFPGGWRLYPGAGTYSISGDKIELKYSDGDIEVLSFSRTANTITINGDMLIRK